jgi:murein DD-endopeptidase MepM/ murein hydrolase activator NlpD
MARLGSFLPGNLLTRAGAVVLLALAYLVIPTSGDAEQQRKPVQRPDSTRSGVLDLTNAPGPQADRAERPAEKLSEDELASVEDQIRARTSKGVAPDDGVSPGAPSDAEVRAELRQLRRAKSTIPAGPIRRGSGGLVQPVNGQFTSPFGQRWGRLHAGIDLSAPTGTPIRAAAAGQVILMAPTGGYGNYTCINHGKSISTCYAHQSRFGSSEGAMVEQGEVVGYVGNTGHSFGAHLHFEVRVDGRPVDPMNYL